MSGIGEVFSSKKANPITPTEPPKVVAEPTKDERLARTGRASLIATSSQGILGNAQTGRKQLSV
jgi:hypothetical protein